MDKEASSSAAESAADAPGISITLLELSEGESIAVAISDTEAAPGVVPVRVHPGGTNEAEVHDAVAWAAMCSVRYCASNTTAQASR